MGGLIFGAMYGAMAGSKFGSVGGVVGAIAGGFIGIILGKIPFILVLKSFRKDFSRKTVAELRGMVRDPGFLAPNAVLLELGSRGEDLEQELPFVLDMLVSPSRERRIRGWHALASAFPKRATLIADNYRIDDPVEECKRKVQKLRIGAPDAGETNDPPPVS